MNSDSNVASRPIHSVLVVAGLLLSGVMGFIPTASAVFERGFYFGFGGGQYREDSDFNLSATSNNKASKLYIGYQLIDWISAEVGYNDFDRVRYNDPSNTTVTDYENGSIFARANLQIPVYRQNQNMTAIVLSGGAHRWDLKGEAQNTSTGVKTKTRSNGVDALFGAGALVRYKDTAFRFDYEVYKDAGKTAKIDLQLYSFNILFYF